jgi:hypothetical protein
MKTIDRSAITITHKKPFIDWTNILFPTLKMHENMLGESKTYLAKSNYDDAEKFIKKNWKEIFENELESICIDEKEWPENRTFKLFNEWFSYEIADWVYDMIEHKPMQSY